MAVSAPAAPTPEPHPWRDGLYVLGMVVLGPIGVAIMLMGAWSRPKKITAAIVWLMLFGAAFGLQWLLIPALALVAVWTAVTGTPYERGLASAVVVILAVPLVAFFVPPQRAMDVTHEGACTTVFVHDSLPLGVASFPLHAQACSAGAAERYSWEDCGGSGWFVLPDIKCTHTSTPDGGVLLSARGTYHSPLLPGFVRGWSRTVEIDAGGSVHELFR